MTYKEALAALPEGSVWTSSFGNVGEACFSGYFQQPDGTRWHIHNGKDWRDVEPFNWQLEKVSS